MLSRLHRENPWTLLVYLVIAVLYTLPMVTRFTTHIPGDNGDSVTNLWPFWYFPFALTSGADNLFHPLLQFYPDGVALIYTSSSFIGAILMAPISLLVSPAAALNTWLLLHIWLGGWFFFRFCRLAGAGRIGAFLGGFLYMCSPFVTVHLPGHYTLVQIGFTAAALFSLAVLAQRASDEDIHGKKWFWPAVGLGLSTWAVMATDFYLAMMTLLLLLPAALIHLMLRYGRRVYGSASFWKGLAAAVAITLILLLPIAYLVLQARETGNYENINTHIGSVLAARWTRLVNLPQYHPVWGHLVYQENPHRTSVFNEYTYIGIVALFVAFVGMLRVPDWRRVVVWIFAFLIALGFSGGNSFTPEPTWSSGPLAFGKYWPTVFPFAEFRVPSRWQFAIVSVLAVCLAMGVDAMVARMSASGRRLAMGVAIFALMAFDLVRFPQPVFSAEPLPSGLEEIAGVKAGTFLDLPAGAKSGQGHVIGHYEQSAQLRQMSHGMPILSAYVARLPTDVVDARKADPALSALYQVQDADETTTIPVGIDWPKFRERYNVTVVRIPVDLRTSESLKAIVEQMHPDWQWKTQPDALIATLPPDSAP